ncbi:hypothetical protein [Achromobacter denitrificans]|uniref:hypothetical protein n=1 Tax=Achromobacter denitrificans TaxID=32002 RepID=UPI0012F9DDE6|nr:hypothetical protein [Achromobacter denitrificans]
MKGSCSAYAAPAGAVRGSGYEFWIQNVVFFQNRNYKFKSQTCFSKMHRKHYKTRVFPMMALDTRDSEHAARHRLY